MYEFDTPRPVRFSVRLASGDITVTAADVTKTTVDVSAISGSDDRAAEVVGRTVVEQHGEVVSVLSPDRGGFLRRTVGLRVTVTVPRGSSVESRVQSADLHTYGPLRDVRNRTGAGDTVIETAAGNVQIECGSGNVRIDQVEGAVRYHSGSGDLTIGRSGGQVVANCASGTIRLDTVRGGAKITSASGDIEIERAYAGDVSTQAVSGNVTVGVPAGVGVFIDANAMSGRAHSELPVSDQPTGGSPQLSLRLRAMSGNIRVVRASEPPVAEKVFQESPAGPTTEVQLEK